MHRYYDFMPDLNSTDPDVLDEMHKVLGFWLELASPGSGRLAAVHGSRRSAPAPRTVGYLPALAGRVSRAPTAAMAILPRRGQRQPRRAAGLLRRGQRRRRADAVRTSAPVPPSGSRTPAAAPGRWPTRCQPAPPSPSRPSSPTSPRHHDELKPGAAQRQRARGGLHRVRARAGAPGLRARHPPAAGLDAGHDQQRIPMVPP